MKTNYTISLRTGLIFSLCFLFLLGGPLTAAEKKIVVIEKSSDPKDKTNHTENGTNLPAGSVGVEVSSLADAATKILAQLGPGDCIKELHFRGHAAPGIQGVGDGVNNDPDKHINGVNDTVWKTALAGLKGKFCPGAIIYMWGCNMGADSAGAAKLQQVANYFGTTAKAPTEVMTAGGQTTYTGGMQSAEPANPAPAPVAAPQQKAKKKKHDSKQSIMIASSSADLEFFTLTQTAGMVNDSVTFHSTCDTTHFTSTLTGTYNGHPLNVTFIGNSSGNASGPWTWTSTGIYGVKAWIGSGTASYTGAGDNFQLLLNSTLNLGSDVAHANYVVPGHTTTVLTNYLPAAGSLTIGLTTFPVEPSLTIDWPNKTVTNDVHIGFVDVVISNWTFDEIQKALDGILKWVKDQIFPTINTGLTFASGTTGTGGILSVSGLPGSVWDDRIGLPGYLMLSLTDQSGNVITTFPANPDGSFSVSVPNACTCVTALMLKATDNAGNSVVAPLVWTTPPPPPVDPSRVSLLIMGTCVDQDFFALTQSVGMVPDSLNYHANYSPDGSWNAVLSGIYMGTPVNVFYNGVCLSSPGLTNCYWSSAGFYGGQPWNSAGNATITGPGGPFQVNYSSNITIGTHSGISNYTINGIESPAQVTYTGSTGMFSSAPPVISIPDLHPSITIDMVNKTVTNDVHIGFVDVVLSEWTFDEISHAVDGILKWVKDTFFPNLLPNLVQASGATITGSAGAITDDRILIPNYVMVSAKDQNNLPLGSAFAATNGSFTIPGVNLAGVTSIMLSATDNAGNTTTVTLPMVPANYTVPGQTVNSGASVCFNATQTIIVGGGESIYCPAPGNSHVHCRTVGPPDEWQPRFRRRASPCVYCTGRPMVHTVKER